MQLTHLGHACVLVEMAASRILFDPGIFTPDLGPAHDLDAVVVTHQHPDHLDLDRLPALLRANPDARLIADPQSVLLLREAGLPASGHDEITSAAVGPVRLTPIGSQHALINPAIPVIANVGVRLDAEGEPSLYHPGDTLAEDPGSIDVLLFPLNAPWQASREMTAFLQRLAARSAIPIHDALLGTAGRQLYLSQARAWGHPETEVVDLAGGGAHEFPAGA